MKGLRIISLAHKALSPDEVGWMYIDSEDIKSRLSVAKKDLKINELYYLCTCNRVEIAFIGGEENFDLEVYLKVFNPRLDSIQLNILIEKAVVYSDNEAITHMFRVASSLESMVVGEREIITQVKSAYQVCNSAGLTGDSVRLLIQKTVQTAKYIYTHTNISRNPVSVVSLAYEQLSKKLGALEDMNILLIGAGQSINSFSKMLRKHNAKNICVFNRTLSKAERIAKQFFNGKAFNLIDFKEYNEDFDVIVSCTGSENYMLDADHPLLSQEGTSKKIIIDLAVPYDVNRSLSSRSDIEIVGIETLKKLSVANIEKRNKEVERCEEIINEKLLEFIPLLKERKVELAMREVPVKVKQIRKLALEEVFQKDINELDQNSRETLDKILNYMEKKYISVPMKMAKKILLDPKSEI